MFALTVPSDDGDSFRPAFKVCESAGSIMYVSEEEFTSQSIAEARAAELVEGLLLAILEKAISNGFELRVGDNGTAHAA